MGRLRRRATIAQKGIAQILETASEYGFQGEESQLARDAQGLARALQRPERPKSNEKLRNGARSTVAAHPRYRRTGEAFAIMWASTLGGRVLIAVLAAPDLGPREGWRTPPTTVQDYSGGFE